MNEIHVIERFNKLKLEQRRKKQLSKSKWMLLWECNRNNETINNTNYSKQNEETKKTKFISKFYSARWFNRTNVNTSLLTSFLHTLMNANCDVRPIKNEEWQIRHRWQNADAIKSTFICKFTRRQRNTELSTLSLKIT